MRDRNEPGAGSRGIASSFNCNCISIEFCFISVEPNSEVITGYSLELTALKPTVYRLSSVFVAIRATDKDRHNL